MAGVAVKRRVSLYVDGFNLYYRALKDKPGCKWLDLVMLSARLFPHDAVGTIRYFTARVKPRPPDIQEPVRQQAYLRALATLPSVTIHLGRYQSGTKHRMLVTPLADGTRFVEVHHSEEKGSDVNLATMLLVDGFRQQYDIAAVISNDSDLALPIQLVKNELHKTVIVVSPDERGGVAFELKQAASQYRILRAGQIKACQFPATIGDAKGTITKPAHW